MRLKDMVMKRKMERIEFAKSYLEDRLALQATLTPSEIEMCHIIDNYQEMSSEDRLEWSRTIRINRQIEQGILPLEFDNDAECDRCGWILAELGGKSQWCPWCSTESHPL